MKSAKIFFLVVVIMWISNNSFSQPRERIVLEGGNSEVEVFHLLEQMPRFPGCEELQGTIEEKSICANVKLLDYIEKNKINPPTAIGSKNELIVVLNFIVTSKGEVKNINILRAPGEEFIEAATKLFQRMNEMDQKWIPGYNRGKPANCFYTLEIKYNTKN